MSESRRPFLVAIDDRELADTKTQRRMGDGRPSAAGAEGHRPPERYAREPELEAAAEARAVSVVADRAAILEHHRVRGAERPRRRRQLIKVVEGELLAGMGDVDACESH